MASVHPIPALIYFGEKASWPSGDARGAFRRGVDKPHPESMNWYYLAGETQRGPVNDEQFRRLCLEGQITGSTFVWHEGMAQWARWEEVQAETEKPDLPIPALRDADSSAATDSTEASNTPSFLPDDERTGPARPGDTLACMHCGRAMMLAEATDIGGLQVCPECKPIVLGRVRTAIDTEDQPSVGMTLEELLQRGGPIDQSRCLREGWNLMKRDRHGLLTVTWGASLAVSGIAALLSILIAIHLPFARTLVELTASLFATLIYGGLAGTILRGLRGEKMTLNMLGAGFGPPSADLIVGALATAAARWAYSLFLGSVIWSLGLLPMVIARHTWPSQSQPDKAPMSEPWALAIVVIYVLLTVGGIAFLKIVWSLVPPLIVDKGYSFWEAMTASRKLILIHFLSIFRTIVVIGAIQISGLLLCGFGILLTAPLGEAMSMALYEQIAGPLKSNRTED